MITGNKGEWSELYVLLYLLGTRKLYAANEKVERLQDVYFPILKIMRSEQGKKIDYLITDEKNIKIIINDNEIATIPSKRFKEEADYLYKEILQGANRAFPIERAERFMEYIKLCRLAAPSSDKTDISLQVYDVHTGYDPILGFSIKSEIGGAPTLLNASGATNFVYEVEGLSDSQIEQINNIDTRAKIQDRVNAIYTLGGKIIYKSTANDTFSMNLMLIDSRMEEIVAEMLLYSYSSNTIDCMELLKHLDAENPLGFPRPGFYSFKYKKLLSAIALGMKPSSLWDGVDEANGGYIIVTTTGDVLAYHLYNRNFFENYLLENTKLERASTTKHNYASLYKEGNKTYIKLNLQIRFK